MREGVKNKDEIQNGQKPSALHNAVSFWPSKMYHGQKPSALRNAFSFWPSYKSNAEGFWPL